jgi:hypothetical protein
VNGLAAENALHRPTPVGDEPVKEFRYQERYLWSQLNYLGNAL